MDLIWLIPLLPGIGAAVAGLVGVRYFSRTVTSLVACATMAGATVLSIVAFFGLRGAVTPEHVVTVAQWIPPIPLATARGMGVYEVPWAFRLDPLSAVMSLVVSGIGFLIHVYSIGYMHAESRGAYARYFAYLNLFCFFMLTLVLGGNFLVMFVGWEGVGLCSYLLIGYWYEKKSAADAGKKAFVVNRVGDWGFILGICLVFYTFGTLDFRTVADAAAIMPVESAGFGVLSLICLLLFIGATGKSAQIPLYVWLPDAMEGPTPVSALIHAATMVTAGVYMVGRTAVLFSHAPMVMEIVAVIGVLTALLAASIGLVQTDIKRVLAYSTISQLGYMFLAMGVGAFGAGIFHLYTHAFFKALLFLGSGAVIHAVAGEQDMRRMGGLAIYMPVTYITMMVGTFAITGIPPLSGFFSKDEILFRAFLTNRALWSLAALTAALTAFYMFRLMSMTFLGVYRGPAWGRGHGAHDAGPAGGHGDGAHAHRAGHDEEAQVGPPPDASQGPGEWHGPHEAPGVMTVPLMVLAVGAIVAGFVGVPAVLGGGNAIERFLAPSFTSPAAEAVEHAAPHMSPFGEIGLMALSVVVAVLGIALAYQFYARRPQVADRLAERWSGPHRVLASKYYVDELYDATVVRGTLGSARGLWSFDKTVVDGAVDGSGWLTVVSAWMSGLFDRYVVDGLVNLLAWVAGEGSYAFRRVQTGLIQNYALVMLFGVFAFVSLYLFLR